MLDILLPKLHKEGQKFLTISLVITFIFLLFSKFLGLIGIVISIWVFYFFRDPERFPIQDNNFLLASADGMICQIEEGVNGPVEFSLENERASFLFHANCLFVGALTLVVQNTKG